MIPKFFAIGPASIETTIKTLIDAGHMHHDQLNVAKAIMGRYTAPEHRIIFQELKTFRAGKQRSEAYLSVDDIPKISFSLSDWTTLSNDEQAPIKDIGGTRVEQLESLCAELYQVLGVYEAPAKVLDKVSAAMNGEPIPDIDLLPFYLEE